MLRFVGLSGIAVAVIGVLMTVSFEPRINTSGQLVQRLGCIVAIWAGTTLYPPKRPYFWWALQAYFVLSALRNLQRVASAFHGDGWVVFSGTVYEVIFSALSGIALIAAVSILFLLRRGKSSRWAVDDAIVLTCAISVTGIFAITLPAFERAGNSVATWHIGVVGCLRDCLMAVPVLAFAYSEPFRRNHAVLLMKAFGAGLLADLLYLYSGAAEVYPVVRVVIFLVIGGMWVVMAAVANHPRADEAFEAPDESRAQWNHWRILALLVACCAPFVALAAQPDVYFRYPVVVLVALAILLASMGWRLQRSIVASHRAMAEAHFLAEHDALTGLFNRRFLYGTYLDGIQRRLSRTEAVPVACCFIDLDNLKDINDRMEHAIGDDVIVAVGKALGRVQAESSHVIRMGGDEFAVLTELGQGDPEWLVPVIAESVRASVNDAAIAGLAVGASVGSSWGRFVAGNVPLSRQLDQFLREADLAQVQAKKAGGGRLVAYEKRMGEVARRLRSIQQALPGAWARGEMHLAYQPVVDLRNGAIFGAEALLRWNHPELGLVPPDEAVRIAVGKGIECELGLSILDRALSDTAAAQLDGPIRIGINLCGSQLRPRAVDEIIDRILKFGDPSRFWVEITEQSLVEERSYAAGALAELRAFGALIAIDDFGSGYCGLDYLCTLPFDILKLDGAFARDVATSDVRLRVAEMAVQIARAVGARVVAEGIESQRVAAIMRDIGCELGQGYVFLRPAPSIEAAIELAPFVSGSSLACVASLGVGTGQEPVRCLDRR